jgi:hypothetical protein
MYESIIPACKALNEFGLARAVGKLEMDRFIFANDWEKQRTPQKRR